MKSKRRTYVVDQNHRQASDKGNGTERQPFKTINRAAQLAEPGDTVLVHAGVYRERVCPARGGVPGRPIIYQAADSRVVVIKGSDVYQGPWNAVRGKSGVFVGSLAGLTFKAANPYAMPLQHRSGQCLGQVFVGGQALVERPTDREVFDLPGSWRAIENGGAILVHLPAGVSKPEEALVELAVRSRVFAPIKRGLGHITVRGFVMEHAANNYCSSFWEEKGLPQVGLLGCRGGHHWTIEDNEIRHAKTFGLDIGCEGPVDADGLGQSAGDNSGYHLIRRNHIHHNGAGGICGYVCPEIQILQNIIEYNETLGTAADESGGIKIHFCFNSRIEGNLIRGNDCSGIWLDNNWRGTRVTRNCIIDNAGAGIFMELGDGPMLIDNNVIAYTRGTMAIAGDGIYSHDAAGVTVAHNLIWFNGNFGVWSHVGSERRVHYFRKAKAKEIAAAKLSDVGDGGYLGYLNRKWPQFARDSRLAEQSRWSVLNNIVVGNGRGAISLPPDTLRSTDNISEANVVAAGYDLRISETWGSPMDKPFFVVNTNKDRVAITDLAKRLEKALTKEQRPNLALWKETPLLTLDQWQQVTGWDRHSQIPVMLRPRLGNADLVAEFVIDDAADRVRCKPVPGVDRDYQGRPMPRRNPKAGPFQSLKAASELSNGEDYSTPNRGPYEKVHKPSAINRFALWPVRGAVESEK
jgi:parallel beta-helix repeat protein